MRLEGGDLVEALANPTSVAVVGASADPSRLSGRPPDYLSRLGYAGRLYAIFGEIGAHPFDQREVRVAARRIEGDELFQNRQDFRARSHVPLWTPEARKEKDK